jgi:hypothetical protein
MGTELSKKNQYRLFRIKLIYLLRIKPVSASRALLLAFRRRLEQPADDSFRPRHFHF